MSIKQNIIDKSIITSGRHIKNNVCGSKCEEINKNKMCKNFNDPII